MFEAASQTRLPIQTDTKTWLRGGGRGPASKNVKSLFCHNVVALVLVFPKWAQLQAVFEI